MISFTWKRAFREARDKSPERPGESAGSHHGWDQDPGRCGVRKQRGQDDRAGAESPQEELPFGADIPQLHAESHRSGETDHDQRGGFDQRVREHTQASKGSLGDVHVRTERVPSGNKQ